MSYPYPVDELQRDSDPASKIDIAQLRTWWQEYDQDVDGLVRLLNEIKASWPSTLPESSWYIAACSSLITCGKPATVTALFRLLTRTSSSEDEIRHLGDRIKDLCMKLWTIVGIPKVITAVFHLAKAEIAAIAALGPTQGDDETVTRTRINSFLARASQLKSSPYMPSPFDASTDQKGFDFMLQIYRHNLPTIMGTLYRHQADFEWLEMRIIYGLFLADHRILSDVESEICTLSGMLGQDCLGPTLWHVRGTLRIGVPVDGVEHVLGVVRKCAAWAGVQLKETAGLKAADVDVEWDPKETLR